jgi:hypothetical protein
VEAGVECPDIQESFDHQSHRGEVPRGIAVKPRTLAFAISFVVVGVLFVVPFLAGLPFLPVPFHLLDAMQLYSLCVIISQYPALSLAVLVAPIPCSRTRSLSFVLLLL